MADGHQGYGVPIGAVLALDGAESPYAVGNDIGFGMALVATRLTRADLLAPVPTRGSGPGPVARDDIMGRVQSSIPAGTDRHRQRSGSDQAVDALAATAFEAVHEAGRACGMRISTSQSTGARP
jgi:RNA-splicing ligase RtcB